MTSASKRLLQLLILVCCASGCRSKPAFHELDPDLNRMLETPRYDAYESSDFFEDGMAMRKPPEGTVPYGNVLPVEHEEVESLNQPPLEVSPELLERGREHFERVCAACHGVLGSGQTPVASHMERPPPSLHEQRIRELPLSKIHRVIERGYGYMPSFAAHFSERDRWAIASYVRALQLSQHAELDQMPEDLARLARKELAP